MKTSLLYIFLLLLPVTLFAQKKKSYYVTGGIGYSFGLSEAMYIPASNVVYVHDPSGNGGVQSYEYVGKPVPSNGITGVVALGYSVKQFELELNMNYLHGFTITRTYQEDSIGTTLLHIHEYTARLLRISPLFKIRTSGKRFLLSVGAGPLIGLVNHSNDASHNIYNNVLEPYNDKYRTHGGLSWGARAEATGRYKINKQLSLFSGLAYIYQVHAPRRTLIVIKDNGKTIDRDRYKWSNTYKRYFNSVIIEAGVRYDL